MEQFLIDQIKSLTDENKSLRDEVKKLNEKVYSLMLQANNSTNKTPKNDKDKFLDYAMNEAYDYDEFLKTLPDMLSMSDAKYADMDYIGATMYVMQKIFADPKTRPIHTYDRRTKITVIKRGDKWVKTTYMSFIDIVKQLIHKITHALSKALMNGTKKNADGYDLQINYIYANMFEDVNLFKDQIALKLLDLLIMDIEG